MNENQFGYVLRYVLKHSNVAQQIQRIESLDTNFIWITRIGFDVLSFMFFCVNAV